MAWWIALLLGGTMIVVAAGVTLISGSSARTQAAAAEQKYFAPTSAAPLSRQDPATAVLNPVDDSTSTFTPSSSQRPTPVKAAGTPAATASSRYESQPSTPRIAVAPLSVPTSIELAGSRNPIRVVPIGVTAEGVLEPPADISTAGWWVAGPRPGTPGRAVITGHIDSASAGLGAFAALYLLHPGDPITLAEADGQTLRFEVTDRQQIQKTHLDPRLLQQTTNPSDLLLVTCIGDFNYSTRSYESNLLMADRAASDSSAGRHLNAPARSLPHPARWIKVVGRQARTRQLSRQVTALGNPNQRRRRLALGRAAAAVSHAQQTELLHAQQVQVRHLRIALDTNRAVGAAVGVLMARRDRTYPQAFDCLVKASQRDNIKLAAIAQRILHTATLPPPHDQADHLAPAQPNRS